MIKVLNNIKGGEALKTILLAFTASVVIGMTAALSLKIPFTPVPFALTVSMVLLFSALLGSRGGPLMVLFYLGQGILGYPVFATGNSGILTLLGPSGGYLMGYIAASYVVGYLYERNKTKSPLALFSCMAVGNFLVIYPLGAMWLVQFVGLKNSIVLGVLPFIITDTIKLIILSRMPRLISAVSFFR